MTVYERRYGHLAGSIIKDKAWLDDGEVEREIDIALREHDAALRAGDRIAARAARSLFLDITDALKERSKWMRCTDRAVVSNPEWKAA